MAFAWDKNDVCLTGDAGGLVAVFPERDGMAVWWWGVDTRQRIFDIKQVLRDDADHFEFIDRLGRTHALTPVTVVGYEQVRLQLNTSNPKLTDIDTIRHVAKKAARFQ